MVKLADVGRRKWTEAETLSAVRLYFELPFGQLHSKQTDIVELAARLQRTPSSVAMKLVNFASLDPAIIGSGRSGLANASKLDRAVWEAFQGDWDGCFDASEAAISAESANPSNANAEPVEEQHDVRDASNSEGTRLARFRRGQDFFRRAVLANFDMRCCITGIAEPSLLVASHIVPWKIDEKNRLNPRNGLALSGTLDRAFDTGLISIDKNLRILVSKKLRFHRDNITRNMFRDLSESSFSSPKKISLDHDAILYHQEWAASVNDY